MPIRLAFFGGVSTVSGNCQLVEHARGRFLVDCGLFSGTPTVRALDRREPPFAPASLDFVLVTHGHLDHAGGLPRLVRAGFRGPIMASEPTCELLAVVLGDLAERLEEEAAVRNRRARRRGAAEEPPLFGRRDVARCLERLERCDPGRWFEAGPGVRVRMTETGHVAGAVSLELEIEDPPGPPQRLLISGDLGPASASAGVQPPEAGGFDHLILSCAGAEREPGPPPDVDARRRGLAREVGEALEAGGPVLIPIFGGERTQELVHALIEAIARGELPPVPVLLDSPLASEALRSFATHRDAPDQPEPVSLRRDTRLLAVHGEAARATLARHGGRAILLAPAGMAENGPIRRHLRDHLWRPEATVLFVGHPVPGTLGQVILSGERRVRIDGEEIAVRARIRATDLLLGLATRGELVRWAAARRPIGGSVFLTRCADEAAAVIRAELAAAGFDPLRILVPHLDQRFELDRAGPARPLPGAARLEPRFAGAAADWHNAYARLLLDIADEVRQLPDDRSRLELLGRLRRTLRA